MRRFVTAVCLAVGTLATGPAWLGTARADFITFNRSAPNLAAIGSAPTFTETYEGVPVNTVLPNATVLNGITYNFVGPPFGGRIDNLFNRIGNQSLAAERDGVPGGNPALDFFFNGDSVVVTFAQPVYGVGIFINAGVSATAQDYFISTPVGTATTGGPGNYDFSTLYFVGLLSDTPFTTATIGSLVVGPSTGHNLDNLSIALGLPAVFVPEPSSLALLTVGALGLLGYARRRGAVASP